jgi:hypothetical protein
MRIIVAGSRDWTDADSVWRELQPLHGTHGFRLLVIHGDEPLGVDAITRALCNQVGIDQACFPRNAKRDDTDAFRYDAMIKLLKPDMLLAFHPFFPNSQTTKAAVEAAERHDVSVKRVSR